LKAHDQYLPTRDRSFDRCTTCTVHIDISPKQVESTESSVSPFLIEAIFQDDYP
jgi:hypothetical protein